MTTSERSSAQRHRGQAMVEFLIVAALVLVPLFLAVPVIGKYLDLRTAAVEASRYAAWERTVWYGGAAASPIGFSWSNNSWQANQKTDDQIAKEIVVRMLSNTGAADAFTASDMSATGFKHDAARSLWRGHDGSPLLVAYDEAGNMAGSTVGNSAAPGSMNRVLSPFATVASAFGPFTLEMNGKYTAAVHVDIRDFDRSTFLPSASKVRFAEANVLVANGWNANGPGSSGDKVATSVRNQVAGLTPTSIFTQQVDLPLIGKFEIMGALQTAISIFFPEIHPRKLEFGKIEPDVVPEDRLK